MVAAVEKAGVPNMVWFNYRRVPAISLAKQLVEEGRIGRPFHYRAQFLQDWTIAEDVPQGGAALVAAGRRRGRLGRDRRSAGPLDRHRDWLNGPIKRVTAATETFVKERMHQETGKMQPVGIDDACMFLAEFANGSMGTFESTRYARGRKNYNTFELNGADGSVSLRPGRPAVPAILQVLRPGDRRQDRRPPDRLAEDPRHQRRAPLHEELVGARLHDRLRAHVHQRPGRLFGEPRHRQARAARLPLALHTQKVCDAVLARPGAGSGKRRGWQLEEHHAPAGTSCRRSGDGDQGRSPLMASRLTAKSMWPGRCRRPYDLASILDLNTGIRLVGMALPD